MTKRFAPLAIFAALLAAVSVSGCLLQPTESPACGEARTCGACVADAPGCGWCGSTNTCVAGSTFGPDEADCPLGTWRFTGCLEPPGALGCGAETECGSCLFELSGIPSCTWCAGRGECIPSGDTCVSGVPVREYDSCTVQNCNAQATCGGCLGEGCDWCDQVGGSCTSNAAECDAHYRYWSSTDRCPPPNRCSSHSGCTACLADPLCGWCEGSGGFGACQAADGTDDYADWCSSGDFYTGFCP